jgi:hypothetical protein
MNKLHKYTLMLVTILLAVTAFSSCDWDNSPEPEYPTKVTYSISASYTEFSGPDELIKDIKDWIQKNQTGYAADANYTTGAKSEFVKQDAAAAKEMDKFLNLFKSYLENDVKRELAAGTYGSNVTVHALFYTYVARLQGQEPTVRTETVVFDYPN